MKYKKPIIITLFILTSITLAAFLLKDEIKQAFFSPTDTSFPVVTQLDSLPENDRETIIELANNLYVPWGIAELPNGDLLVTERSGNLKRISDGSVNTIDGVVESGEGGLLGIAIHPDFKSNNFLYLYMTSENDSGLINRVERYTYSNNQLSSRTLIISDIPGASYHDGGRIAFGPDNLLYITTGDAGNVDSAQDTNSLAGKILRINDDGSIPEDNPFNNEVYSYGHRNPQGLAWDNQGRLWSTEHGPSGLQTGNDELNLIVSGGNYGWPVIKGQEQQEGMISPVAESGTEETWAPAGLTYYDGALYFAGLRGESLYKATVNDTDEVTITVHFRQDYGRLRTTLVTSDNKLLITTSNTDGRGEKNDNDDLLISVPFSILK